MVRLNCARVQEARRPDLDARSHHVAAAMALDRLLCQTCPATATITMMPPTMPAIVGASAKQTQTQAIASGVSSVLSSAFSVAETI